MNQRLLCLIGSGEMARGMVSLHADLMSRVGSPPAPGAFLDTPYGFQENADEISEKAQAYFQNRVRHPIEVASLRNLDAADPLSLERVYNQLRRAAYVFAGPGSPSYALRQWRRSRVPELLRDHLRDGGAITFASAAAVAIGKLALPVYEVYKVGEWPHWVEGLDLLTPLGLDLVVIPHFDNAEGGTHDTRYCYMGERRLIELERQLPPDQGILGIAEHTAAIIDFEANTMEVRGRGFVAVRRSGVERRFAPGPPVPLTALYEEAGQRSPRHLSHPDGDHRGSEVPSIVDVAYRQRASFERALGHLDTESALRALLQLDDDLASSLPDTRPSGAFERARSIYRGMLVHFGETLQSREPDPQRVVAPFVELALRMRDEARRERRYSEADQVRDALAELKIEVRDTPAGTDWSLSGRN
jgi:hypothetical protein